MLFIHSFLCNQQLHKGAAQEILPDSPVTKSNFWNQWHWFINSFCICKAAALRCFACWWFWQSKALLEKAFYQAVADAQRLGGCLSLFSKGADVNSLLVLLGGQFNERSYYFNFGRNQMRSSIWVKLYLYAFHMYIVGFNIFTYTKDSSNYQIPNTLLNGFQCGTEEPKRTQFWCGLL